jgi:hypothetical protein
MKDSRTTRMPEIADVRRKTRSDNLKKFERKSRRENGEKVTVESSDFFSTRPTSRECYREFVGVCSEKSNS